MNHSSHFSNYCLGHEFSLRFALSVEKKTFEVVILGLEKCGAIIHYFLMMNGENNELLNR